MIIHSMHYLIPDYAHIPGPAKSPKTAVLDQRKYYRLLVRSYVLW